MTQLEGLPTLTALGDELRRVAAAEAASPHRRTKLVRRRPALVVALLVLLLAATAAAGTLLVLRGAVIPGPTERIVGADEFPVAGSSKVEPLRAPDPGTGPPWTIRISHSRTGLTCTTVGQVVGGRFGLVGLDGRFRAIAEPAVDGCGQVHQGSALIGARVFDADHRADVRTVVAGDAGPGLAAVVVDADQHRRSVVTEPDGTFATVLRGYPEDAAVSVTLRYRDGRVEHHDLGRDPSVVPDPAGGPAWTTEAGELGRPVGAPAPAYHVLCVQFRTAREQPGPAISPGACGRLDALRAGRTVNGLFFAIRRITADHRRFIRRFAQQLWNRHSPRTAVWGFAGSDVRAVTVLAPDGPHDLRVAPNRAFLAIFRPTVDPRLLRVRVTLTDGSTRTYARSHGLVRAPGAAR